MKKVYSLILALFAFVVFANAQSQLGEIRGKVIDSKTKKPLDYASVTIELNGVVKATTLTDDEGGYIVKTLQPGEYTVKVTTIGYRNAIIRQVDVISDQITFVNVPMEPSDGKMLDDVVIVQKRPLVDPEGKGGATKTAKEIMALPQRNANMVANTVAGVDARAGGTPNFRGARADGTAYYIDGVRVQAGSINIPQNAVDQIQIITGGVPAQYGDFIGGAIAINTKAPSKNWMRGFEFISSSPFNRYLDNSHYNELQGFVSGPLLLKDKGKGDKERVLVGFSFAGSGVYARDGRLPATDMFKVKDAKLREIEETPLVPQQGGGFIPAGEYLTRADLEPVDYRLNASTYNFNIQGNFSYQPTNNISVRMGYQGAFARGRNFSYVHSLTNYNNNSITQDITGRVYLQFTQTFAKQDAEKDKTKEQKSVISNAFYTVRVSYENRFAEGMDAEHERNLFNYGYVGTFTRYTAPAFQSVRKGFGDSADVYTLVDDQGNKRELRLTSYARQVGFIDTALTFEQASVNRIRGNYTRTIYDYYRDRGQTIRSISNLRGLGGSANGDGPLGIYSNLWTSPGAVQASYSKSMNETYTLFVMTEATAAPKSNPKAKHDLQFGFTYEQQFRRGYSVNSNGLWTLMRQLVNQQFSGMDYANPIVDARTFDANGVFNDTLRFRDSLVSQNQSTFDRNLRNKLIQSGRTDVYGNPIDQYTRLNSDGFDPSMYSIDMFSADELLNNGNSYVSYFGYDYKGNRVGGKPGLRDFLADPTNRTLGAFQPVYMAAWAQDKFVFKDLIVRLGVRMERFDANQVVLKDPYTMAPAYTAGDVRGGKLAISPEKIPGSVGNDYTVYVNDENQANSNLQVTGFRSGNDWFDKNGNPVTDPSALWRNASAARVPLSRNQNIPFLINPGQIIPDEASFVDYTPDFKLLPRIWFSFPISTTSQFFGTYDVLAQRPTEGNVAQIDDYFFLNNRLTGTIANPDLKMTQVTDYEIGFRQQIGDDASLGIIASYREFRNLIQLYRYVQAWPNDYTTFGNLDFSTVKSIRLEYELRDLGNINISANYMLQFAEGTGSNSQSSAALVQVGLPTLRTIFPLNFDTRHTLKGVFDYHYKSGKEYNGPVVGGKKIFENAGFNVIFNATSGRPYTQTTIPVPEVQSGVVARTQVKSTINGANLPSQFYTDINIDKNFEIRSEGIDKNRVYRLRVFLWVQNIFNNVNVLGVYRYTGSAYDDGFITSTQADAQLRAATNAQSLVDLYNVRMVNPANFALPRLTRLGLALYF
ncbi:MAG: carboxypeptidase regulatory-like domain-containing protein [Bacteroidota bacterium]|jgi:hypothetical protein|nr:TonB-dependent receptor [Sphingobacteriales bacterium]